MRCGLLRLSPVAKAGDLARFVELGGERWFRSGDLGKWINLGGEKVLCVSGRVDRQAWRSAARG